MSISKITSIKPDGSFNSAHGGPDGKLHGQLITFEDGTVGTANSKMPTPPYAVGDTVDYNQTGVTPRGVKKLKVQKVDSGQSSGPGGASVAPGATSHAPARSGPAGDRVHGQTVGMALKEAISLCTQGGQFDHNAAEFWKAVKQAASNIIRISESLEKGHLSPPSWETKAATPAPAPKAAAPAPQPEGDDSENVPF